MYSSSGNWKRDVFDGCIAESNLETGERQSDVAQGLYMPHNVTMFDGSLHVLDSLPGHLRTNNFSIIGTFSAFTRGIAYKQGLYFIGQSKIGTFLKCWGYLTIFPSIVASSSLMPKVKFHGLFNFLCKLERFIPLQGDQAR